MNENSDFMVFFEQNATLNFIFYKLLALALDNYLLNLSHWEIK